MKRFLNGDDQKNLDSFELYINSGDLKYDPSKGYVVDLKDTPIVGASSVEITTVELPVSYYNVVSGQTIVTDYGTVNVVAGKYTSAQFATYLDGELKTLNAGFSCVYMGGMITIANASGFIIGSVSSGLYNILGVDIETGTIGGAWPVTTFTFQYPSRDNIPLYFGITSSLSGIIARTTPVPGSSIVSIGDTSASGITSIPNTGTFGDLNLFSDTYFNPLIFKNKLVITEFTIQLSISPSDLNGHNWSCTITFYF